MKKMIAGLWLVCSVVAHAGEVEVSDAWARATAPGQVNGMVAMKLVSKRDGELVAARSDASQTVEIHSMEMSGGMMKMRQIDALPLVAGEPAILGPGGHHLMLIGLKKPLRVDGLVKGELTVRFADGKTETVPFSAKVMPMGYGGMGHGHHGR